MKCILCGIEHQKDIKALTICITCLIQIKENINKSLDKYILEHKEERKIKGK